MPAMLFHIRLQQHRAHGALLQSGILAREGLHRQPLAGHAADRHVGIARERVG